MVPCSLIIDLFKSLIVVPEFEDAFADEVSEVNLACGPVFIAKP